MSTFFGLNIARLGMQAQQKALEVTSHNIANANTPGYSRQVAHMTPTAALTYAQKGMLGTGVLVDEIARIRDAFLDRQIRQEQHTLGQWKARSAYLEQIEQIFMEPTESGVNAVLSTFFDSWQELSINPESSSARTAVIENANFLINTIRHTASSLISVRDDIRANIELKISEVNSLAAQISDLNQQITNLVARNDQPSDLMDRRDLLLEQLAEIIDFDLTVSTNGSINVYVAGRPLVHENISYELKTVSGGTDGSWTLAPKIAWAKDNQEVDLGNGEIYGLIKLHDENLRRYLQDFEIMAWGIVNAVNNAHQRGIDLNGEAGLDFFQGTDLQNLRVNSEISSDPAKIAAALPDPDNPSTAKPGDGSNAVAIAQLRNSRFRLDLDAPDLKDRLVQDDQGSTTLEYFYRDTISRLGVDAQESSRMKENQTAMLELMTNRRLSISGVSLDEEMANMVQFQLAYQAAARFIATLDEIYNTLINGMIR
ncbi:MAG: flagellar hook-associated protein FlgK [Firmicutes bacterium]|nr:flagellar hook-associated protein FlgK [Bacillota bacterium]